MDGSMADIPNPLLRVMDKDPRPFTGRGQARSQDFERVGGWVAESYLKKVDLCCDFERFSQ